MKRPAIIIFFDGEKQHTIASTFTDELIERPAGRDFLRIVTYQDLRDVVADVAFPKVGEQLTMLIGEQTLEETNIHHAITECYEGAVYYSQGRSHLVEWLDLERGIIQLVPRETGYYTEPLIQTDVDILCTSLLRRRKHASLYYGDVLVTRTVTSYVKRHSRYRNMLDRFDLEHPLETELETKALWILVDDDIVNALQAQSFDSAGSLHATEHSLIALLPLHVLGDRRDVGGVSVVPVHSQTNKASIFIYDGYPGGMGYAEGAYHQFTALAQETFETLRACTCEGGCLSCVQSPKWG